MIDLSDTAKPSGDIAADHEYTRNRLASSFVPNHQQPVASFRKSPDFEFLLTSLIDEHQPTTPTELALIRNLARHDWLHQRAFSLQEECLLADLDSRTVKNRLNHLLRFAITQERAASGCLRDLLNLRKEKLALERGFVSQKREEAAELRREAAEKRKQAAHIRAECREDRAHAAWRIKKLKHPQNIEYILSRYKRLLKRHDHQERQDMLAKVISYQEIQEAYKEADYQL